MSIALLLLGPGDLKRSRWFLFALGILLVAAGAAVALDASETVTSVILEAVGWILVVMGLGKLAFFLIDSGGRPWPLMFKGAALVAFGFALSDFTSESGQTLPWLFGVALILNGLYQSLSALVIRYPRWGWWVALGAGHVVAGGVLMLEWRHVISLVVPVFMGAGLLVLGITTLRAALRFGHYSRGAGGAETAVRYYLDFHVARRFHEKYLAREPVAPAEIGSAHGELLVHVWTPTTVAKTGRDPNIVSRYIVAEDREGKFAVGHSAMQMDPDVYISHCDGNPDAFDDTDEVWRTLRSRDVAGVYLGSFDEEVAHYMQPSATIRFRHFKEDQLRVFWALYRAVTDYNFTNRNCSVVVAMALEAALMGSLSGAGRIRRLLSLMTNKDLWVAHFIRWKAREMVWTPGLMLDYARALERVVEAG